MSQVLRTGPVPCSTHLQEYTCWCPPAIPCRDALPTCHPDHSATEDQEQGPPSRIGQRTTRRPSRPECFIPQLSLPDQVTVLHWTNSLSAQWCQDPLATHHRHLTSSPWILPGWSRHRRTLQMSPWPHPRVTPRCREEGWHSTWQCSPCYAWVAWSLSSTVAASSAHHCTCCSRNNPTARCTHSKNQHSTQDSCTHTRAFTSSTHWSCATADRCCTCCPALICPCH